MRNPISKFWPEKTSDLYVNGPESFPPRFNDLLPILAAPQPKISIQSFWSRCNQMGQISQFFPWREYFAPELTLVVPKVSLQAFLLILAALPSKISIRIFWLRCNQMGQVSEFFPIFGRRAPKMGKNSRRETFGTIGA